MKFLNILALVTFASAAPTLQGIEERQPGIESIQSGIEERQSGGVADTIAGAVAELVSVTNTNLEAIKSAIEESKNAVDANVIAQISAAIQVNFERIAAAFRQAGATILAATQGAGGNIVDLIRGLSDAQLASIRQAVADSITLVNNIRGTITGSISGVQPAIRTLVLAELNALQSAIGPFLTPLQNFIAEIQRIRGNGSAAVTGLASTIQELGRIVRGLIEGLGLPSLNIPTNSGLGGLLSGVTGLLSIGRPNI